MPKAVEFRQSVARVINYTTWKIPRIKDGDKWRNIKNKQIIENPHYINGYDHFENAIFSVKKVMKSLGWRTSITSEKELCHVHLYYLHYRLICRK